MKLHRSSFNALHTALLVTTLPGCLLTPEDFEAAREPFQDLDGDGVSEAEGDCAPTDPSAFPGAPEWCDGRDNDCDGSADNNPVDSNFYVDADRDGHGDPRTAQAACAPPEGFVASADDCDDTNPNVYPDADEACNDIDDDCDGTVDEGAPADRTWFPDGDGDGYGVNTSPLAVCAPPGEGYVVDSGDCNDDDPHIHPNADERCNGIDDDCDEERDEEPTIDPLTWTIDSDDDGYGADDSAVMQCLSPGERYVVEGGDCDDLVPTTHPGADELCDGIDNDCDGTPDDPPTVGDDVWYVDGDLDGYGDADGTETSCEPGPGMIETGGDCDDTDPDINPDASEVCNDGADNNCDGSPNSCVWDADIDMGDHIIVPGLTEYSTLGMGGASGDLDGDGIEEIYVSDYNAYDAASGEFPGLICGWEVPIPTNPSADLCSIQFTSSDEDGSGFKLDIGDINADGYDDLLIGSAYDSAEAEYAGGGSILLGPVTGGDLYAVQDWELLHTGERENLGYRARILDDMDSNGTLDYALSGRELEDNYNNQGGLFLYTNVGTGSTNAEAAATATFWGDSTYTQLGTDMAAADIDGDGRSDLIVGEDGGAGGYGAARLFLGPLRGSYTASDADISFIGEHNNCDVGTSVETVDDLNGDGYPDILVSGDQTGTGGAYGTTYVVWGASTLTNISLADADVKLRGDTWGEAFGWHVRALGDLNEDGWPDIGVTSRAAAYDNSAAYIFHGPLSTTAVLGSAADADIVMHAESGFANWLDLIYAADATGDGVLDVMVGSGFGGDIDDSGVLYIVPGVGY